MFFEIFRIFGLITGWPLQWLFFKRKVYYEDESCKKSLKKGGKLVITNHYSVVDYVTSCFLVCPRKLWAVTSEIPYKSRLLRFGMKFFGTIQANRITRNMKFIDESAEILKKGKLVQIFPEGRNTPDGKIHDFKRSYIVIAHRAGVPIVPVITDGNYGLFTRNRMMIGKEIDLSTWITSTDRMPPREQIEQANEYIFQTVLRLREELAQKSKKKEKKR